MNIRLLTPADVIAFQALQLRALQESPTAFGSSFDEEKDSSPSVIESRLTSEVDRGIFGAFDEAELIGMVALARENMQKLSHKGFIWGMYVAPNFRRKGVGRTLLVEALKLARSMSGLRQVNLCVNATGVAAIKLYESVGFVTFGSERAAMFIDGQFHDELHMCANIDITNN
jgi:ribosomal protein S18 acetylase RimI-like enzyme